jgi:hypothetical protein
VIGSQVLLFWLLSLFGFCDEERNENDVRVKKGSKSRELKLFSDTRNNNSSKIPFCFLCFERHRFAAKEVPKTSYYHHRIDLCLFVHKNIKLGLCFRE